MPSTTPWEIYWQLTIPTMRVNARHSASMRVNARVYSMHTLNILGQRPRPSVRHIHAQPPARPSARMYMCIRAK